MRQFLAFAISLFFSVPALAAPQLFTLTFRSPGDGAVVGGATFKTDPEVPTPFMSGDDFNGTLVALISDFEGELFGEPLFFEGQTGAVFGVSQFFAYILSDDGQHASQEFGLAATTKFGEGVTNWMFNGRYLMSGDDVIVDLQTQMVVADTDIMITPVPVPAAGFIFGADIDRITWIT